MTAKKILTNLNNLKVSEDHLAPVYKLYFNDIKSKIYTRVK